MTDTSFAEAAEVVHRYAGRGLTVPEMVSVYFDGSERSDNAATAGYGMDAPPEGASGHLATSNPPPGAAGGHPASPTSPATPARLNFDETLGAAVTPIRS